jgi:hypothetical protein
MISGLFLAIQLESTAEDTAEMRELLLIFKRWPSLSSSVRAKILTLTVDAF